MAFNIIKKILISKSKANLGILPPLIEKPISGHQNLL